MANAVTLGPPDLFSALPTLGTPRLVLRALTLADVDDVFAYNADADVARYMTWAPHATVAVTRAFVGGVLAAYGSGRPAPWAIEHRAERRVVGTCGFVAWEAVHARAELGFVLARAQWGRGYMTEALRAVIGFGFERMGLQRIEARCMRENTASAAVMRRLGMTAEGTLRAQTFVNGRYHDMHVFSVLRDEWPRVAGAVPPAQGSSWR